MADKMIVILEPEITAVENMYHFIKNALFRKLRMSLREYGFKEIVEQMWERRDEYNIKSLRELMDRVRDDFSYVRDIIDKELSDFKIYIILNKIRSSDDIFIGFSIKSTFIKHLGVNTKFVGYVEYDDAVWRSIRERRPFMLNYSLSRSAKEVEVFTENLLQGKEVILSRD
jgi:flagellar biosynthesis protein FlhG